MNATADPFAGIPNADDSLNGEFSPAATPKPTGTWTGAFSPADQYGIGEVVAKAGRYLAAAHHAGLPEPWYISMGSTEVDGQPHHSHIAIQFSTASKVVAWADHFGAEILVTDAGTRAELPGPVGHDVTVYSGDKAVPVAGDIARAYGFRFPVEAASLPGLSEHTGAACDTDSVRAGCCDNCGRIPGMPTWPCGECPDREIAAARLQGIEVPGLDEHTAAACDTITRAAHKSWCGANTDFPAVVPTSADAICCKLDTRNASNRPASCAS